MANANRTLNVEIIGASGLKDTEWIGKADPFVKLTVGKEVKKTKKAKDQPKNPVWNETFSLLVHSTDIELLVQILNDELFHDDDMGRAIIPLSSVPLGGSHTASVYPLELKGKPHGEITMSLSFDDEERHEEHHGDLAQKVQGLSVGEKQEPDHVGEHHEVPHGEGPHEGHHHGHHSHHHGHHERQEKAEEKKLQEFGEEGTEDEKNPVAFVV